MELHCVHACVCVCVCVCVCPFFLLRFPDMPQQLLENELITECRSFKLTVSLVMK